MPEPDDRLAPGTEVVLGRRYRIEAFLGAGGFAQVYRARELDIDRVVALKVLDAVPLMRPGQAERFFREAQAAARIAHPDVVVILEHGLMGDGRPCIAQAFLDGHDLHAELQIGPLEPARALPLFARVLDALAAAHEAGVVHRDLKPANLFLDQVGTRRERLVILDFGVACFHEQLDDRLTASGGFLGTPRYMSPEYVESRAVGPSMDVYQMALVIVEALTGRPAVAGNNAYQCMVAHVQGELRVPGWLRGSPLGPPVLRALAHDPDARPSAADLRDAIEAIDPASIVQTMGLDETIDAIEEADAAPTLSAELLVAVPPPLPAAAGPRTEHLPLDAFKGLEALPADVFLGPRVAVVASAPVPTPRRVRWPLWAAAGVLVTGVALAVPWVVDGMGEPADATDAIPDAISDDIGVVADAMLDATLDVRVADAMVDGMTDGIVDAGVVVAEPRRIVPPRPPRPSPEAAQVGATPDAGADQRAPTTSDLLRWTRGLPGSLE